MQGRPLNAQSGLDNGTVLHDPLQTVEAIRLIVMDHNQQIFIHWGILDITAENLNGQLTDRCVKGSEQQQELCEINGINPKVLLHPLQTNLNCFLSWHPGSFVGLC